MARRRPGRSPTGPAIRRREQFVQRAHAQQAGAVEGGTVHIIGTGQGLHMGIAAARLHALGAPRLHHHHRLGAGGGTRSRHELARVLDLLDVEQDGARTVIGGEVVEQIAEVDVQRVAQRDHGGEPDRARHAPLHQCGGDGRGFEINARSPACGKCAAMLALSRACGAITPRQCGPRMRRPCLRATASTCADNEPGPSPARGEDDRRLHATFGGSAHHLRHDGRWCGDHRQVGDPVQVLQPLDRADAIDLGMPRIDPRHLPGSRCRAGCASPRGRPNAHADCRRSPRPTADGTRTAGGRYSCAYGTRTGAATA